MKEEFLNKRLNERREQNAFRHLKLPAQKIDFCSNDYLGISARRMISVDGELVSHGSTGSRLLSGNYSLIEETEAIIAAFHQAEAGLIFNSGYDANLGLLSCVAQRGDAIIYDYLCHASIRDGIRLSFAHSFSFEHNDLNDLEKKLRLAEGNRFVVTESLFSMDGDMAPISPIVELCKKYSASLIVDEAHATGVVGDRGEGLIQQLGLEADCFARVHTFGKAVGCHGAIVLGSSGLRNYLINFCRPLIFSTAPPGTSIAAIKKSYEIFPLLRQEREHLKHLATVFKQSTAPFEKLPGDSAIQGLIIPGNDEVKSVAAILQQRNFDVRPILYPTVPKGKERLRIVLHAFNSVEELSELFNCVKC